MGQMYAQEIVGFDFSFQSTLFARTVMNKTLLLSLWCVILLLVAAPLHAQTGCTDSPENPTVVLALVGSAGALFSTVRARLKARRNSSTR
jgi:XrtJ-associated TM-motif-TM protein